MNSRQLEIRLKNFIEYFVKTEYLLGTSYTLGFYDQSLQNGSQAWCSIQISSTSEFTLKLVYESCRLNLEVYREGIKKASEELGKVYSLEDSLLVSNSAIAKTANKYLRKNLKLSRMQLI